MNQSGEYPVLARYISRYSYYLDRVILSEYPLRSGFDEINTWTGPD
jgi:hypothetical protein